MCETLLFGVKDDFMKLINTHALKESYDYNDFLVTWNDLEFYHLFSGRPDIEEMKFFVEHTLMMAKELIFDNSGDLKNAAAFFLLYTLYAEQPLLNQVKIRIEFEEFRELVDFIIRMSRVCKDIPFGFYSLLQKEAFHYVYSYLKRTAEKNGVVDIRNFPSTKEKTVLRQIEKPQITDILKQIGFNPESWNKAEALYNSDIAEMKEAKSDLFSGKSASQGDSLEKHDFLKELQSQFEKLYGEPAITEKPEPRFHRKLRLENKILNAGSPSTPKEKPVVQNIKTDDSLPFLFDTEDEDNDEEEVDSPEAVENPGPSLSMPIIKPEAFEDDETEQTPMEES